MAAVQQLSGTIVVIIIAVGVQACIILFIFAKRQIQRFALRNRRGPHMSIGHGGPKTLRREADKLLDYVQYIKHEPVLEPLPHDSQDYRRLLMINFQSFEYELASYSQYYIRPPCGNVRAHMISCTHGPLTGVNTKLVHQVCDDYNSARHHYEEIDINKYQIFLKRLDSLRVSLRANKLAKPNPSPLPPPQSFSDSPRKRRGRGYTNATSGNIAQNSGAYNRKSENANKKQCVSSKVTGFNSGDNHNSINLNSTYTATARDNSSFTSLDVVASVSNMTPKTEDGIKSESNKLIADSERITCPNSAAALSSIVSVETGGNERPGSNSAAV